MEESCRNAKYRSVFASYYAVQWRPRTGASPRGSRSPEGRRRSRSRWAAVVFEAGSGQGCRRPSTDGEVEAHARSQGLCSSSPRFPGFDPGDRYSIFGRDQAKVILCFRAPQACLRPSDLCAQTHRISAAKKNQKTKAQEQGFAEGTGYFKQSCVPRSFPAVMFWPPPKAFSVLTLVFLAKYSCLRKQQTLT